MVKTTSALVPGDIVYWKGERVMIERIVPSSGGTCQVYHSLGYGFFNEDMTWFIDEPLDDIVRRAEEAANERIEH